MLTPKCLYGYIAALAMTELTSAPVPGPADPWPDMLLSLYPTRGWLPLQPYGPATPTQQIAQDLKREMLFGRGVVQPPRPPSQSLDPSPPSRRILSMQSLRWRKCSRGWCRTCFLGCLKGSRAATIQFQNSKLVYANADQNLNLKYPHIQKLVISAW